VEGANLRFRAEKKSCSHLHCRSACVLYAVGAEQSSDKTASSAVPGGQLYPSAPARDQIICTGHRSFRIVNLVFGRDNQISLIDEVQIVDTSCFRDRSPDTPFFEIDFRGDSAICSGVSQQNKDCIPIGNLVFALR
jgi:hypothetical protein